jgi:CheY-like chemotaxis protein
MLMATNSPGILIVDDNEDNRYTLQLMLETDGHERIASASAHGSPGWEEAGLGLPRRSSALCFHRRRRRHPPPGARRC